MASGQDRDVDAFDDNEGVAGRPLDSYTVHVKGQVYAVGLLWNNIENRATAVADAREMAARTTIDADLYCIRQNGSQYGLGRKSEGHAKGMIALAGALADTRGGNWAGAFATEEGGYYIIAVRDDDVLAQTDKLYGDEIEAKSKLEELMDIAEYDEIFAPDSFGFTGTATADLETAIGRARGPKLQDTDRIGGTVKWLVGGLLVAALIAGGLFYMNYENDQAQQAQFDSMNKGFTGANKPPTVVVPPMPWEGKPVAAAWLKACEAAMDKADLAIPGWTAKDITCQDGNVTMDVQRDGALGEGGGTINWIRWALDKSGLKDASASPTGLDKVNVSWAMGKVDQYPVVLDTPHLSDSRRYLQSWFEESFTAITFPAQAATPFVATLNFHFVTQFQPSDFASILEKIPGLTVDHVTLNLADYKYTVEGSFYEKLPLPAGANAPAH